jgi:hypothetical protein
VQSEAHRGEDLGRADGGFPWLHPRHAVSIEKFFSRHHIRVPPRYFGVLDLPDRIS